MRKLFISLFLVFMSFQGFGQEFITDDSFDDKINERHAFGDADQNIVVVEFWAKFNEANAFADWDKVKGVKYFRIDVGSSPEMKKKYRIRMAPTIILFNKGIKEDTWKAGLDLECTVDIDELQEAVEDVKTADNF